MYAGVHCTETTLAWVEVMVRNAEHHVCIHGDKTPVTVIGETPVARSRRERGDGHVVEA
jgi:hypothetical protein